MKVALVTGSAKGIGKEIALNLADLGYTLVIHYRASHAAAREVLTQVQKQAPESITLQADLTQLTEVEQMFSLIHKHYGQLDILVNNVGNFGQYHRLEEVTLAEFDDVLASNVRATFMCTQLALPLLRKSSRGRVINFSCASAEHALARTYTVPYYIAKSGIVTLTKSWAEQLANDAITVNSIAPGIVENSVITQDVPMHRPAQYQDVTSVVRFLISEEADYISGSNIEVSGGWIPHHE